MGKTLYGKVEKNEFNYEWKSEPGACEVCQKMDGTIYESADDIPAKPHPNCKCWINLVEKEKPSPADPIEARRAAAKDRINAQKELAKLHGDVRVIQDEVEIYINDLDKYINQINELEELYQKNNLENEDKIKIAQAKQNIKSHKYKGEKLAKEIKGLENEIEKILTHKYDEDTLNVIDKAYFILKIKAENYIANDAPKEFVDKLGLWFSKKYNSPEAFELYKVASETYGYNKEYIEKNGIMYDSINQLNNKNLENEIRSRIKSESNKTDTKVLVLNDNSSLAKTIIKDNDFQKFLNENKDKIKKNKSIPDQNIVFSKGDTYNSLHGAMIKNIKLDKDGNLTMRVEDYYNFNPGRTSARGRLGERLQNKGELENFYIIISIKIPHFGN